MPCSCFRWLRISIFILAGGVIQVGDIFSFGKNSLNNKPLLGTYPPNWNENEIEFSFEYHVINYGSSDAKGVEVSCNIYNQSGENITIAHSYRRYIGTVPAFSDIYEGDIFPVYPGYERTLNIGAACIVSSCSNSCEILYKRVPTLAKVFG